MLILFFFIVRVIRTRMDPAIASTPPSLEGIARKIAYANRKYHSGWMCAGVVVILAVLKFSTSPSMFGLIVIRTLIVTKISSKGVVSFTR